MIFIRYSEMLIAWSGPTFSLDSGAVEQSRNYRGVWVKLNKTFHCAFIRVTSMVGLCWSPRQTKRL